MPLFARRTCFFLSEKEEEPITIPEKVFTRQVKHSAPIARRFGVISRIASAPGPCQVLRVPEDTSGQWLRLFDLAFAQAVAKMFPLGLVLAILVE